MLDLSVVIPCYNESTHLEESVDILLEVLEQTKYNYEVIFVDDKSKDNTRDIVKSICEHKKKCRFIFHDVNQGRGAAFKTGFSDAKGKIVGFIDIDLEVHALYIPALVIQIKKHGYDIATGYRHYLLSQTGGIIRDFLSRIYRLTCKMLLGLGVRDTETGYKFFKKATTESVVLKSESNGWFWDTEVMSRSVLSNLRIYEMPVLFLRRWDKKSTVRLIPDIIDYMVELYKFRNKVGLSMLDKSPVYWTSVGYNFTMKLLYGKRYQHVYEDLAKLIPGDVSVIDVCCGTCRLYYKHLKKSRCTYLGLDFNGHFVMAARNRGVNTKFFDLISDDLPASDYVIMCSSFYHFHNISEDIFIKLKASARKALIISEPVENLSPKHFKLFIWMAEKLSNPGIGECSYRYNLEEFRSFAEKHNASEFLFNSGNRNAVAVFNNDIAEE